MSVDVSGTHSVHPGHVREMCAGRIHRYDKNPRTPRAATDTNSYAEYAVGGRQFTLRRGLTFPTGVP